MDIWESDRLLIVAVEISAIDLRMFILQTFQIKLKNYFLFRFSIICFIFIELKAKGINLNFKGTET